MKHAYLIVIALVLVGLTAQAANLNVYCGQKRPPNSINAALKLLNPQGPNTLIVYGTCKENVVITSFDNLTLQAASGGASINDASEGNDYVLFIQDSTRINIQGFTINGGAGVICYDYSVCRFTGNTIQGSGGTGVYLTRSRGTLTNNIIQNNADTGLSIFSTQLVSSGNTIQSNAGFGVFVNQSSYLAAVGSTIRGNSSVGVQVLNNSTFYMAGGNTITENEYSGVTVQGASAAIFGNGNGDEITTNNGDGIEIADLSLGRFNSGLNITGNLSGTDVACLGQYPAVEQIENIAPGTTNCVIPSQPTKQVRRGVR